MLGVLLSAVTHWLARTQYYPLTAWLCRIILQHNCAHVEQLTCVFSCKLQSLCWSVSPVALQALIGPAPSAWRWLLLLSSCFATAASCGSAKCRAVGGFLACHKSCRCPARIEMLLSKQQILPDAAKCNWGCQRSTESTSNLTEDRCSSTTQSRTGRSNSMRPKQSEHKCISTQAHGTMSVQGCLPPPVRIILLQRAVSMFPYNKCSTNGL